MKVTTFVVIEAALETSASIIRCKAITKNTSIFSFTFELGFNRCILMAKKFFPNLDTNLLTLIDLDAWSLIKEVLEDDPYS